jgi:hypothetical protein
MSAPDTCAVCGNDFHFGHAFVPDAEPVKSVFEFVAQCGTCEVPSRGRLVFDEAHRLVGADGGALTGGRWTCDGCVGGAE